MAKRSPTRFKIVEDGLIRYSARERRIFAALSRAKEINSDQITEIVYGDGPRPWNARLSAMATLRSLKKKMHGNNESCRIASTKASGPKPMSFWIEEL
jgi:hypothetical protein